MFLNQTDVKRYCECMSAKTDCRLGPTKGFWGPRQNFEIPTILMLKGQEALTKDTMELHCGKGRVQYFWTKNQDISTSAAQI